MADYLTQTLGETGVFWFILGIIDLSILCLMELMAVTLEESKKDFRLFQYIIATIIVIVDIVLIGLKFYGND